MKRYDHLDAQLDRAEAEKALFNWLLRQPAVKAQAYFWNHSSRSARKKAIKRDMKAEAAE